MADYLNHAYGNENVLLAQKYEEYLPNEEQNKNKTSI